MDKFRLFLGAFDTEYNVFSGLNFTRLAFGLIVDFGVDYWEIKYFVAFGSIFYCNLANFRFELHC